MDDNNTRLRTYNSAMAAHSGRLGIGSGLPSECLLSIRAYDGPILAGCDSMICDERAADPFIDVTLDEL